jgi:hypothetical protein
MADHGCQPTSEAFLQACRALEIRQALTSDHHPKGHAETERVMRTLKEECFGLREWPCPVALFAPLERWSTPYHDQYLPAAPG